MDKKSLEEANQIISDQKLTAAQMISMKDALSMVKDHENHSCCLVIYDQKSGRVTLGILNGEAENLLNRAIRDREILIELGEKRFSEL